MHDRNLPEIGDVVGLRRLLRESIRRIEHLDVSEQERAFRIGLIREAYRAAVSEERDVPSVTR